MVTTALHKLYPDLHTRTVHFPHICQPDKRRQFCSPLLRIVTQPFRLFGLFKQSHEPPASTRATIEFTKLTLTS